MAIKKRKPVIPGYFTRDEAAAEMRITPQGIDHHAREGLLSAVMIGRSPLFPQEQVDALVSQKNAGTLKRGPKAST